MSFFSHVANNQKLQNYLRENLGPTKYPREKILNPREKDLSTQNTHESTMA